jgi:uncharacterized protein (TIGR02147 family)
MNIFSYNDYKKYIVDWVEQKKAVGIKVSYQALAEIIGVQKTYLSRVINGTAQLSLDQTYLLVKHFQLSNEEVVFFGLLVEKERTGLKEKKIEIEKEIDSLQNKFLKTDQHITGKKYGASVLSESFDQSYYLNPLFQVIHIGLTIKRYAEKPDLLRSDLGVNPLEFSRILTALENMKLISYKDQCIEVHDKETHLSRESQYFWPWYTQMTSLIRDRSRVQYDDNDLNFTVTFTADTEVYKEIKSDFFKFLEKSQKRVKKSKPEKLYQMSFDLLKWMSE